MSGTKTRTAIHDPELKKLRAVSMIRDRVLGLNNKQLAEKYHLSDKTVERTLSYAKRAGLIVTESDHILESMVPLARKVLIDALLDNDRGVALEIYKGTGLLGNKGKPSGGNSDDDELMRAMNELRARAQLLESTTEGELIAPRPQTRLLGESAADAGEEGLRQPAALTADPQEDRTHSGSEAPQTSPSEDGETDDISRAAESILARLPGREGEPGDVEGGEGTPEV
jgi:hypothetical protein